MSFDEVGANDHPIARGEPGGAENGKTSCWGTIFPGGWVTKAGEGGGGSNGGAQTRFDGVGARDHPIAHGEPGGAEKQKPSHCGSVFAGRCITKAGEGGGGSNGGG